MHARFRTHASSLTLLCAALALTHCGSYDHGDEDPSASTLPTGSLGLELTLGDGYTLDRVDYVIHRPGFERTGSIPVTNSTRISAVIGGLPAASGYQIELSAASVEDVAVTCSGQAGFAIQRARATRAHVAMTCQLPPGSGRLELEGSINVCPRIETVSATPSELLVGGIAQLEAVVIDVDRVPNPVSASWSSTGGTLVNASSAGAAFRCDAPGVETVALEVSDGECGDRVELAITCTEDVGSEPIQIRFNEIESNGGVPGDWVEIVNLGTRAVDLSGWLFQDNDDSHRYVLPSGTLLAPGATLVLDEAQFGFGLGANDSVRLTDAFGVRIDEHTWTGHAATTYGRCPDGVGPFVTSTTVTKGAPNDCSVSVVINEVESNGGVPGDWVELYNPGPSAVNLSGWLFRDNDDSRAYTLPAGSIIPAGGYLVLEEADFGFGLGANDSARLFEPSGASFASYSWTSHAATTYGRCPNASGDFATTAESTKGAVNACGISYAGLRLNEVESNGGVPGDWVELINIGPTPIDLSGVVFKDNDDTHAYAIPVGTSLAPGAILVLDEAQFGFGLGANEMARLFDPSGSLIDSYSWTSHATTTYGRCPDGSGDFASMPTVTKGLPNDCGQPTQAPWPGSSAITPAYEGSLFGGNMSGLTLQPASASTPAILWAVQNGPGTVFRLERSVTGAWARSTADGWSAGKRLRYPDGTGNPDGEGIAKAEWDAPWIYVATERNNEASSVSRMSVLRVDGSAVGSELVATHEWNLTSALPAVGPNLGLEAITWLPDTTLVARGFRDTRLGKLYDPADYPAKGAGLFILGVEATGMLHVVALNHDDGSFQIVTSFASGFPGVMGIEFDRETEQLWVNCDDTCGNLATVFTFQQDPTQSNLGHLVAKQTYAPPADLPNLNNEGIAIAPEAECVSGYKGFLWADDGETGGLSMRGGSIACGVLP